MNIDTNESCPMCSGNGKIDSSLLLVDKIETKINKLISEQKGPIHISTHPFTASYLNQKKVGLNLLLAQNGVKNINVKF